LHLFIIALFDILVFTIKHQIEIITITELQIALNPSDNGPQLRKCATERRRRSPH